jgi:hypothetical protein
MTAPAPEVHVVPAGPPRRADKELAAAFPAHLLRNKINQITRFYARSCIRSNAGNQTDFVALH